MVMLMQKLKFNFTLISILTLLFSCGADPEEAIEDAIFTANQLLSKSKCQEAIDVLEGVGRQVGNKSYLIALASGFACRGKFSELTLFTTDITKSGVPSILGGFRTYSSSVDMTSAADSDFLDVNLAIEVLTFAGGIATTVNPTSAARKAVFGPSASGDIDAMILYLTMVNLGRWLRYHANADATDFKTGCVLNYDGTGIIDDFAQNIDATLSGPLPTGTCIASNLGSIGTAGADPYSLTEIVSVCEGVFLLNNFLDVLPNVLDNYSGGELGSVSPIRVALELQAFNLRGAKAGMDPILAATNQTLCKTQVTIDQEFVQWYYVYMMEPLYL